MVVVKLPELERSPRSPCAGIPRACRRPARRRCGYGSRRRRHPGSWGRKDPRRCCARARISRASWTGTFSVRMTTFDIPVDADQFENTVAHGGRRQVDHADVEFVAIIDALADVVIDRDRAGRGLQHLAPAARRCAEHDIAARIGMADRRDAARFVAEDIQHANPVLAGRHFGQRVDADEILELIDTRIAHCNPRPVARRRYCCGMIKRSSRSC